MPALTKEQADAWSKRNKQAVGGLLDVNQFIPVSGDIQSGIMAGQDLSQGNYGSAALNAVGLLPFVPALGGMTKSVDINDISKLREQFKTALQANRLAKTPESIDALNKARASLSEAENIAYAPVSEATQSVNKTGLLDYGMQHRPPMSNSGAPLYDLTGKGSIYPSDIYSNQAVQYYGTGDNALDYKTFNIANKFKNNPDAELEIYRAIPKNIKSSINSGDWVTINKDYAKQHGNSILGGDYKIVKKKVKAKDIYTSGDSIHEWGYDPQ
jgi:hypothetical protein